MVRIFRVKQRVKLLITSTDYIPAAIMIPPRRIATLLHQARAYQRQHCIYHNPPPNSPFSLYNDHRCSKDDFPRITTTILEVHTDEVWCIEWSHDGNYLASGGKDKSAIVWRRGVCCTFFHINDAYSCYDSQQSIPFYRQTGPPISFFVTINILLDVWLGR